MITTIIILSVLNIFFMFAYAKEVTRRDRFRDYLSKCLKENKYEISMFDKSAYEPMPRYLFEKRDLLIEIIKEFNK